MLKSGLLSEFVSMTKLFFTNVSTRVKVNGLQSFSFNIERGVKQGCPLIPYLFFIVVEVLNYMMKEGIDFGRIREMILLIEEIQ